MSSPDRDDPLPDEDYELLEDETRVRRYLYKSPDQPTEVDQVDQVEEEPYLDEGGFYVEDPEVLDGDEGELYYEEDAPGVAGEPYEPDDPTEVLAGDEELYYEPDDPTEVLDADDIYDEPAADQVDVADAYYEPDSGADDPADYAERDRVALETAPGLAGGDRPLAEQLRSLTAAARARTLSADLGLPPRTGARLLALGVALLVVGLMLALLGTAVSGP
jgi:hypothetical protein